VIGKGITLHSILKKHENLNEFSNENYVKENKLQRQKTTNYVRNEGLNRDDDKYYNKNDNFEKVNYEKNIKNEKITNNNKGKNSTIVDCILMLTSELNINEMEHIKKELEKKIKIYYDEN